METLTHSHTSRVTEILKQLIRRFRLWSVLGDSKRSRKEACYKISLVVRSR